MDVQSAPRTRYGLSKLKAAKEQYLSLIELWPDDPSLPLVWQLSLTKAGNNPIAEEYFRIASELAQRGSSLTR